MCKPTCNKYVLQDKEFFFTEFDINYIAKIYYKEHGYKAAKNMLDHKKKIFFSNF